MSEQPAYRLEQVDEDTRRTAAIDILRQLYSLEAGTSTLNADQLDASLTVLACDGCIKDGDARK